MLYIRIILATLVLSVSPSWASITISDIDPARGTYVDYLRFGGRYNSYAGVILGAIDITQPIDLLNATLFQTAPQGFYNENVVPPLTDGGQQRISWLYMFQLGGVNSPTLGAGLQLAIWDIMADGGDGPTGGYLQSSSGTPQGIINAWLNYLNVSAGQTSTAACYYIIRSRLDGGIVGTYVGAPGGPNPPPPGGGDIINPPPSGGDMGNVPEPTAITTIIVGIAAIVFLKRRK